MERNVHINMEFQKTIWQHLWTKHQIIMNCRCTCGCSIFPDLWVFKESTRATLCYLIDPLEVWSQFWNFKRTFMLCNMLYVMAMHWNPRHTHMYEIRYAFRFLVRLELFQSLLVLLLFFWSAITQIVNLLDDAPKIQILRLSPTGILWLKCSCGPLKTLIFPIRRRALQKKLQLLGQSRNTYRCEAFRENAQLQKHV